MIHDEIVSPNIRVADILEQIERLDTMIIFHKKNSPDDAMLKQYRYLRRRYSLELARLMKKYNFHLSVLKVKHSKSKAKQIKPTASLALPTH